MLTISVFGTCVTTSDFFIRAMIRARSSCGSSWSMSWSEDSRKTATAPQSRTAPTPRPPMASKPVQPVSETRPIPATAMTFEARSAE